MLVVDGVNAFYDRVQALRQVSLRADEGEIVAVVGSNGAGKTTLLRTISGVIGKRSGRVLFRDREISRLPSHEIVRLGVCQVPEGRRIFAPLTVYENLQVGALPRYGRTAPAKIEARLELVYDLFPRLRERHRQRAGTLSGGEQQMLAIGRALMAEPALLLLDEPSIGLAPMVVASIFDALQVLNRQGLSILLVEQNMSLALELAPRAYVMSVGRIVLEDSAAALMQGDTIRRIYLGERRQAAG